MRTIKLLFLTSCLGVLACSNGQVLELDAPCGADSECAQGLVCRNSQCSKVCSINEDCPSDRACEEQICKPVPNPRCRQNNDCDAPGACDLPGSIGLCIAGHCEYPPNPDNPCDGCIDESTRPCYTGPTGTKDVGACTGGVEICTDQNWGVCQNEVVPTTEICNTVDDDCDGEVDEGFKDGAAVFDGGPYANDNGKFLGASCGTGVCAGGTVVCNDAGDGLTCSTLHLASTDLCDTQDNDCDGSIDEDFVAGTCETGLHGICAQGTTACSEAGLECIPDQEAVAEIPCNGLDDDCDGEIDENSYGVTAGCPAPNCAAILEAWNAPSGPYFIETPADAHASCGTSPMKLYCDMNDGGWTLVFWHDGNSCKPIGPSSGYGEVWFLADCEGSSSHSVSELAVAPLERADTNYLGEIGVSVWVDIRTMPWSHLKIAGYQDPDANNGNQPVSVSSSEPIPRSDFALEFGHSGYYLENSPTHGYYWCGGAETTTCKGRTSLDGGWDFSTEDEPDRWLTIRGDISGEPNCPSNTLSTCRTEQWGASCWSPQNDFGHGGQAVWVR